MVDYLSYSVQFLHNCGILRNFGLVHVEYFCSAVGSLTAKLISIRL